MAGEHGSSLTPIYWTTWSAKNDDSSPKRHTTRSRIVPRRQPKITLPVPAEVPIRDQTADSSTQVAANTLPPVGTPFGTAEDGSLSGEEVRPALPVATTDPAVSPDDLRGGVEGNEVVEITIDDKGNIVQKVVVQSLSPAIDAKVLAALENWRFRPATRNGVPIPSKQDVYYHFPRRG